MIGWLVCDEWGRATNVAYALDDVGWMAGKVGEEEDSRAETRVHTYGEVFWR